MRSFLARLWPASLTGRLFIAVAIALLVAQSINAVLLYRAQNEQNVAQLSNAMAVRLIRSIERLERNPRLARRAMLEVGPERPARRLRRGLRYSVNNPIDSRWRRLPQVEKRLSSLLTSYEVTVQQVQVARDPRPRLASVEQITAAPNSPMRPAIISTAQLANGDWLSVSMPEPPGRRGVTGWLIFQTVTLYLILLAVIFYITRTLSRPLARLTKAVGRFADSQEPVQLEEEGPRDVTSLIGSFNRMSARIGTMLDEKDVMLGAIGHDLKTPLSALRVRVEAVEDDRLRDKMVASIEDIHQSLDDILMLARVGRNMEEKEAVNLSALLATIVDEFAALEQPVTLEPSSRIVAYIYTTWFRRAIRNLISNAVRYGGVARVAVQPGEDSIIITIEDDGPGIPPEALEKIFTPFFRLEESRNVQTGGAGLGLTLARAIAEQHDAILTLSNRHDEHGNVVGLLATFSLPRN